ncbi:mucin-19 isoform X2 [Scaptodrosophila lebanonensis]|uniref:Mucin-19 isoform X2 n=1 Tax=Drosophila lebanonensis TaxID=7225 RepID=A0A6J2TBH4_DROLE|nr:mucin-19 isoform X2 [Scaptodrosophila lebanonensis]
MSASSEGAGGAPVSAATTAAATTPKTINVIHPHTQILRTTKPIITTRTIPANPTKTQVHLRAINKNSNKNCLPPAAHATVAAKITHVKPDGSLAGAPISITGAPVGSTIMTGGTIKVAGGGVQTSLSGTPISLNTGGQATTAASIRAIGAGGQSTQVRVVMPMIKQLENVTATGRTQITAIPAAPARSVSNASITVTRPVTQTTYLPRAGVGVTTAQRLVTPLRATSSAATVTPTAAGLTTAGGFVRGTSVSRSAVSQPSTVISSANSAAATAWMQGTTGQVQLIRAIHQPARQRIISTTGGAPGVSSANVAVSGSIMTTTATPVQTQGGATGLSVTAGQGLPHAPPSANSATPQAYVATVLPPRQHQATLVYSNVSGAPNTNPNAGQQFNPSVASAQRFAVATPLGTATTTTPGGTTVTPRQVRPIPLGKSFPTSISIRAPSIPQLSASLAPGSVAPSTPVSVTAATVAARGAAGSAVSVAPVLTTTNLPTTRIIQLQQPTTGGTPQILGSTARLTGNVMLQPFLMSTTGAKMGIRPPVTMTAKVQPSLTITQLNPIGKLSTGGGAGTAQTNLTPQSVAASIQALGAGSTSTLGVASSVGTGGATVTVSQGGTQLLPGSNLVSSGAGAAATGGATVLPLAISTRGGPGNNILTPIKNASGITVGNLLGSASSKELTMPSVSVPPSGGAGGAPTSVFIQQRAGSAAGSVSGGTGGGVSVSATGPGTAVATSSVAGAFLPQGSATIYYESMPASNVQVSTGVLSLTTTTLTQSTHTHSQAQQLVSSSGSLSVSSLPFASHSAGSTATFTVVPSSSTSAPGARTISQLQLQAGGTRELGSTLVQAATAAGQQLLIPTVGGQTGNAAAQHMVIPLHTSVKVTATTSGGATVSALPVPGNAGTLVSSFMRKRDAEGSPIRAAKNLAPTLLSMSSNNATVGSAAATTVTPVNLHSGTAAGSVNTGAGVGLAASMSSSAYSHALQHVTAASTVLPVSTSSLTVEALAKKDRAAHAAAVSSAVGVAASIVGTRNVRADSPASSDGSTTVSANSSPGVEQQMQDSNLIINRIGDGPATSRENTTHFNPINELYASHPSMQQNMTHTPINARTGNNVFELQAQHQTHHLPQQQQQQATTTLPAHLQQVASVANAARMNGGSGYDCPARKKPRRSTNDSQHSTQSQTSLSLPAPTGSSISSAGSASSINVTTGSGIGASVGSGLEVYMQHNNGLLVTSAAGTPTTGENNHRLGLGSGVSGAPTVTGNKENANPVDFVLRRPRNCALLNTFKPTHKLANNHFHRYTDVKPREERRPTVIDLANQPNVHGKISGWKVYHLRSQMEDLNESEMVSLNQLETMLKELEKDKEKHSEIERISELLKGNIQRSKIVTDGINEAQLQIMKIFDHKPHVSDIINRCASKRNFKKREKI